MPGLTLQSYKLRTDKDLFGKGEIFLFGVAGDATLTSEGGAKISLIPFGYAELAQQSDVLLVREVGAGQTVEYLGEGLMLVPPPTSGFLTLRLIVAESDAKARAAAEVVKTVGEAVGDAKTAAALAATGLPQAAAVAFLAGKSLEAGASAMKAQHDDVVEAFEGTFTKADMTVGKPLAVHEPNAEAVFQFIVSGEA